MERVPLSDEMKKYGYVFSLKRTMIQYSLVFAGLFVLGRFFGLTVIPQAVIFGAGILALPFFLRNSWKNRYFQRKISDLNIYMEQFLYSFQKSGKILQTLEDVALLFERSEMKGTVCEAIDHIRHTYNESDFEANALRIIEREYPYDGLRTIHKFALRQEEVGGDCSESIQLLLDARRMWADRLYELLQVEKVKRREIILSILTSLLLCSMIYYMAGQMDLDVAGHPFAQFMTTAVLLIDLFIYYKADLKLSAGFEDKNGGITSEKEMEDRIKRLESYGDGPIDSIGRRIAEKNLTREIEKRFPEWLMQISLLLQTENVISLL